MHSHEEELARADAEATRLSTASYDKEVELEVAKERLDAIERADEFDAEAAEAAEREVERLEQEAAELLEELRGAADYLTLVESRAQGDYDEDDD
jgi:hypothetical protein